LDLRQNVGILKMNREHRYNTLTPNYIKGLRRGIESLNIDDNVLSIYIAPEKGEHFCNGTDFRTLVHYKNENAPEKIA
jgi:enoyl-CoA hydratase/carnithine racemase